MGHSGALWGTVGRYGALAMGSGTQVCVHLGAVGHYGAVSMGRYGATPADRPPRIHYGALWGSTDAMGLYGALWGYARR